MAEIDSLRRQIRDSQERLERMNREEQERSRKAAEDIAAHLRGLQADLERSKREIDDEYERKVRLFQEAQMRELQRVTEELRRQDAAPQRKRQEALRELSEKNAELRRELEAMIEAENIRNDSGRVLAEARIEDARTQEERVGGMPHEFFFHGQLDICREHLLYARSMLRGKQYEAAAASADSALAEMEALDIRVQQSQQEWEDEFRIYRLYATELKKRAERFEEERLRTPCGSFSLDDDDRAYWSRGEYGGIRAEVEEAYRVVEEIDRAGVTPYLNAGGGMKKSRMIQANRGLQRLSERLTAVTRCISAERFYSDQRFLMGETACDILEDIGAEVSGTGFRDGQPIDSYDVTASVGGNDTVTVTFLPEREDGVVVRNRCLVALDARTAPNPQLVETLARDITARLRGAVPELAGAEWYAAADARSAEAERRYKREPDTRLLAKKLELKYQ